MSDVATVRDGVMPQWARVVADGKPAVCSTSMNSRTVTRCRLPARSEPSSPVQMPAGVAWRTARPEPVRAAIRGSVRDAVLVGLVLAGSSLAVPADWRVTLIAVLSCREFATSVLLLSLLGMSFNIMTLGGIAAAVGLLIDDVIVMVEHIARRAARPPGGRRGGQRGGASRRARVPAAVDRLDLATLIVFLPLSFLTGVTGAFSKALSITMAAALTISYLITAFVVPVLAFHLVNFDRRHDPRATGWLVAATCGCWRACSRGPGCLLCASCRCWPGWLPPAPCLRALCRRSMRAALWMDYYTQPGTSLTETIARLRRSTRSSALPEVEPSPGALALGSAVIWRDLSRRLFRPLRPKHVDRPPQ